MGEVKATRTVAVTNSAGFHLRAATLFVNLARQFDSRIEVLKDAQRADGKSTPLQLTALGAWEGDRLVLEAFGADAAQAVDALVELFAANFDEEDEPDQQQVGQGRPEEGSAEDDLTVG